MLNVDWPMFTVILVSLAIPGLALAMVLRMKVLSGILESKARTDLQVSQQLAEIVKMNGWSYSTTSGDTSWLDILDRGREQWRARHFITRTFQSERHLVCELRRGIGLDLPKYRAVVVCLPSELEPVEILPVGSTVPVPGEAQSLTSRFCPSVPEKAHLLEGALGPLAEEWPNAHIWIAGNHAVAVMPGPLDPLLLEPLFELSSWLAESVVAVSRDQGGPFCPEA